MSLFPVQGRTTAGLPVNLIGLYRGYYLGVVQHDGKHLAYFWNLRGQVLTKNLMSSASKSYQNFYNLDGARELLGKLAEFLDIPLSQLDGLPCLPEGSD